MLQDPHNRIISYLRVSVTDRCNFRCVYCLPESGIEWLPRDEILSFEEMARVVSVGATLGLSKIRLTGGEPTLRRDLPVLVRMLTNIEGIREVAMTTNAAKLGEMAQPLKDAGLNRLNISIDTLRPEHMKAIARRDVYDAVMQGIETARAVGLPIKFNAVVMRGQNEDELCDLLDFAHQHDAIMRFIEWMPMGQTRFDIRNQTVETREMRDILSARFDLVPDPNGDARDPARPWICLRSGARAGFISSMSDEFCATCNRMRLTSEGGLRPCLHQDAEVPIRELLRDGGTDEEIAQAFQDAAGLKWAGHHMTSFIPLFSAKEMIKLGG